MVRWIESAPLRVPTQGLGDLRCRDPGSAALPLAIWYGVGRRRSHLWNSLAVSYGWIRVSARAAASPSLVLFTMHAGDCGFASQDSRSPSSRAAGGSTPESEIDNCNLSPTTTSGDNGRLLRVAPRRRLRSQDEEERYRATMYRTGTSFEVTDPGRPFECWCVVSQVERTTPLKRKRSTTTSRSKRSDGDFGAKL